MIHIATVHEVFDRWVEIQLGYLERHVDSPYRLYACLTGDAAGYSDRFFFADTRPDAFAHQERLNYLAGVILEQAAEEDILVFLDGDAFPIAELVKPLTAMLERSPLAAIRRDENQEPHPHPSFCATTVGFWREIQGDWRGVRPDASLSELSPEELKSLGWKPAPLGGGWTMGPGARLLKTLADRQIDWLPILRTNRKNIHPLFFGVYGHLIYHHGAGFRQPFMPHGVVGARARTRRKTATAPATRPMSRSAVQAPDEGKKQRRDRERDKNRQLDRMVFAKIKSDPHFHRELFYAAGDGRAP
jgi:hypothetical protein